MTLDNGTALFNYVPPYIVTEKKKHNIIRNVRIRYKMVDTMNYNELTTPHHDINIRITYLIKLCHEEGQDFTRVDKTTAYIK